MTERCFYFGCWNKPGHYLVGPGGRRSGLSNDLAYQLSRELDSQFAPMKKRDGTLVFGDTNASMDRETRNAHECPQGQFLRHTHRGFTLIQWWDRCQGDSRGACNSTVLLEGEHTSERMLAALVEHFPHVIENLKRAGVELVEVKI